MNVLITAGSTCVPIDNVRRIGNIFSGKTGIKIAQYFLEKDSHITLLNSKSLIEYSDDNIKELIWNDNLVSIYYKEFNDLKYFLQKELTTSIFLENGAEFHYDVIIHSAAVSDYGVDGAYEMGCDDLGNPMMWPIHEAKIKSGRNELYLKLVPLPKIIDLIRTEWGFKGILVKFKLESQKSDKQLIDIAIKSMKQSDADFIVANCLEWYSQRAFIISKDESVVPVVRDNLNSTLYDLISQKL
jgi:phosphopantothenoylcysteine synthetase/decarboxylase